MVEYSSIAEQLIKGTPRSLGRSFRFTHEALGLALSIVDVAAEKVNCRADGVVYVPPGEYVGELVKLLGFHRLPSIQKLHNMAGQDIASIAELLKEQGISDPQTKRVKVLDASVHGYGIALERVWQRSNTRRPNVPDGLVAQALREEMNRIERGDYRVVKTTDGSGRYTRVHYESSRHPLLTPTSPLWPGRR